MFPHRPFFCDAYVSSFQIVLNFIVAFFISGGGESLAVFKKQHAVNYRVFIIH